MPSTLKTFSITPSDGQYLLTLEEDDGSESEFLVTYDQLDLIVEEIDRQLNSDEEKELEVSDEGEE